MNKRYIYLGWLLVFMNCSYLAIKGMDGFFGGGPSMTEPLLVEPLKSQELHRAVKNQDKNAVKALLKSGIAVDEKNEWGATPLLMAIDLIAFHPDWRYEIVKLLVTYGADVNAECENYSILNAAILGGDERIVQFLLENGAEANDVTHLIIVPGFSETLNFFGNGFMPLHQAAVTGNVAIVRLLIEKGADVKAIATMKFDDESELLSVLSAATLWGQNPEVVALLLEHGALVNDTCYDGDQTLLHVAVGMCNAQMIKILLDYGADIHCKNDEGDTALDLAIEAGNEEVVELLQAQLVKKITE